MTIHYTTFAINFRLNGVVSAVGTGGNGNLLLLAGATTVSTISLANPCGTVNSGVLTFTGQLLDPSAASTGLVTTGSIYSGDGTLVASGLTAGIPGSGADIIISNGLNSTLITAGQTVALLSAQITGS